MDRTYDDALSDLELIVARYGQRIDGIGDTRPNRRQRERLGIERDAIAAALEELREGAPNEDTADCPPPVMTLVEWLNGTLSREGVKVPVHPHAGTNPRRAALGGVGHCWVCATVGHQLAHPERQCADVGCTGEPDDAPTPEPAAAPSVEPVEPVDGPAVDALGCDPGSGPIKIPGVDTD